MSSAHLLAALALVLAVGGGGAFALEGKNSVDTGDIRKGAVRGADIRNNAVRGVDVREKTLDCGAIPGCGAPPASGGSTEMAFGSFLSDEDQVVAPGQAVSFDEVVQGNQISLATPSTVTVAQAGVYAIDARAIASSGGALAIEVDDAISSARSGIVGADGPVILDSILTLRAGATLRLVNTGTDPVQLTGSINGATVNSAELDMHRIG